MRANSATPSSSSRQLHVSLLWMPAAMPGNLLTALDVLQTASAIIALQEQTDRLSLSWEIIAGNGRRHAMANIETKPPMRGRRPAPSDTLILIPALHSRNAPYLDDIANHAGSAMRLLEKHAADGGWIAANSTGLILPARLGMLKQGRIPVPWAYQSWFARRFPECDFSHGPAIVRRERLFACVAPALQTEFMLTVLDYLLDPQIAAAVSHVLLHQPHRQKLAPVLAEQKWFSRTADSPVYRAIEWMTQHPEEPYSLPRLAAVAATSERTLLRHFRLAMGMTPLEHLQQLRVERAKMLLEASLHDMHTIATACGYADAASFRRLFKRLTGVSPADYRTGHALRSRRQRWRVEG